MYIASIVSLNGSQFSGNQQARKMLASLITVLCFCVVCSRCEYLNKKLCDAGESDPSQCTVHNVVLEPCSEGGSFCTIKRTKRYTLSVDILPKFSAERLELTMYADEENSGAFNEVVKTPADACDMLFCPVEADTRRIFDIDFSLGKTFNVGKYPVKVKIFNKDNEKQGCCFTFNVQINK